MFIDHLKRLGIVYANPETPGGGDSRKSLMERTDEKVSGTMDKPELDEEPEKKSEEPDEPSEPAKNIEEPNVTIDEEEEEDEPTSQEPEKEEPDQPKGEEPDEGEPDADDPDGEPEVFYDPERDVDGKPAHPNTFKTRENGEFAAVHKANQLKETLEKMDEAGIDRGAIPLPDGLNGSLENVDTLLNVENIAAMDDESLKQWLHDSDKFRHNLEGRMERKQREQKIRQTKNRKEELEVSVFDGLQDLMSVKEIQDNAKNWADIDKAVETVNDRIDQKVKEGLSEQKQELESWIDQVEQGEIDITPIEFDRQKQQRLSKMQEAEQEIREQYSNLSDDLQELHELASTIETETELTPKERAERSFTNLKEWQEDRSQDGLAILADNPEAKAELVAFKNWALQNFDDLHEHPSNWNKAFEGKNGWLAFKKDKKAARQKKELQGPDKKNGTPSKNEDDDIPKPGDQDKLKGDKNESVYDKRRRSMKKVMELTDATIGT